MQTQAERDVKLIEANRFTTQAQFDASTRAQISSDYEALISKCDARHNVDLDLRDILETHDFLCERANMTIAERFNLILIECESERSTHEMRHVHSEASVELNYVIVFQAYDRFVHDSNSIASAELTDDCRNYIFATHNDAMRFFCEIMQHAHY